MDTGHGRLGIDDLADLGGVSRRTVRYYVQEGLLPPPLGVGRGRHYDESHLRRLLDVKAQQEAGLSLDEIRSRLRAGARTGRLAARGEEAPPSPALAPAAWRRIQLAPGVELHVADDIRLPAAGRLGDLADWCRTHLRRNTEGEA